MRPVCRYAPGLERDPAGPLSSPLRVAVLSTRRAPGLDEVLAHPARGREWDLSVLVATDPASSGLASVASKGVPVRVHDLGAFSAARGVPAGDLAARAEFDRATRSLLAPFRPDLVVLCGYLHIVTEPLLEPFPDRIVNVHDADLSLAGPDGLPRYRGLHSTREAVFAGEPETRSTVHLATPEVDMGPALLRSWAFPTHPLVEDARAWGETIILKAYAYAQREWMMRASWGTLLGETLGHFARGEVRRLGDRVVVDGRIGPRELAEPSPAEGGRSRLATDGGRSRLPAEAGGGA
jgi:phosphoribosylglycinamide formyltransferase 1